MSTRDISGAVAKKSIADKQRQILPTIDGTRPKPMKTRKKVLNPLNPCYNNTENCHPNVPKKEISN